MDLEIAKDAPKSETPVSAEPTANEDAAKKAKEIAKEFGGPKGPEPTRYGDWEKNGRCIDF